MIAEYFNQFPDYPRNKAVLQEYLWHMHRERRTKPVSNEEILREAAGKPPFGTAHGSKTTVSRAQEAVLRLLFRWFAVDPLKGTFTCHNAEFNELGYRRSSYAEARRCIRGLKKGTWRWCIAELKKAGLIQAYQDEKRGEIWGAWWLRLNPCRVIQCVELVLQKRSKKWADIRPDSQGFRKCLSGSTLFSSSVVVPSAIPIATADPSIARQFVATKKKNKSGDTVAGSRSISPEGGIFRSDHQSATPAIPAPESKDGRIKLDQATTATIIANPVDSATNPFWKAPPTDDIDASFPVVPPPPIPGCPVRTTDEIVARQPPGYRSRYPDPGMDEVLKILSQTYPEVLSLNEADYRKIYRLVTSPVFKVRLDAEMARNLVGFTKDPDASQILGARILGFKTFIELVPEWYNVTTRILRQRLVDYDAMCSDSALEIESRAARILDPVLEKQTPVVFTQNYIDSPGPSDHCGPLPEGDFAFARYLAWLLQRGIRTKVTEALAVRARDYLMQRPSFYVPLWEAFPEVKDICKIPEPIHRQLVACIEDRKNEIAVWRRISEHYGDFE